MLLAIVASLLTISLKAGAWALTDSIGLLSDAAEGLTNLAAGVVGFWLLTVAARPPDEEHAYGHSKAEYFSSGVESSLILVAAVGIAWFALGRLLEPEPLENVSLGLAVSVVASIINGAVAFVLLREGRRINSITLTADGRHLLTDVWTSAGVIVAILLVGLTGWLILDPVIALVVAVNIVYTGIRLLNDSAHGLLDTALPPADQAVIASVMTHYRDTERVDFHALRTRQAGQRRFISMHVLVPGAWSVQRGHALCEKIERDLIAQLPKTTVFTHLESLDDPASWNDMELDRPADVPQVGA
ncbi:MAG TPA: cation diffusion facilitator family transporter [Chloroflexia bacterium]|nr:cation diffusion facilitator family transporter [Chloroflexia bacterium]